MTNTCIQVTPTPSRGRALPSPQKVSGTFFPWEKQSRFCHCGLVLPVELVEATVCVLLYLVSLTYHIYIYMIYIYIYIYIYIDISSVLAGISCLFSCWAMLHYSSVYQSPADGHLGYTCPWLLIEKCWATHSYLVDKHLDMKLLGHGRYQFN